jgi:hypothetical protein
MSTRILLSRLVAASNEGIEVEKEGLQEGFSERSVVGN